MRIKNKFPTIILSGITLTFLFACRQANSNQNTLQAENSTALAKVLSIDTFSVFPPEIDGCSCYFSTDSIDFKNSKFIYMDDYAQTSFLKINGILTKFTRMDFKEVDKENTRAKYRSDNYEMTIDVKYGEQTGDETMLRTGTINLTDKNGNALTSKFYGECGC